MQRPSLIPFLVFLVSVTVGFIVVWPEWKTVNELKDEKILQEKSLEDLKDTIANINELSNKYDKSEEDINKLAIAIPSTPQIPELLIQVEELVKKNGLILGNIDFSVEGGGGEGLLQSDIGTIAINVSVEGTYAGLKNILNDIEKNIRLMDVVSVNFSKTDKETGFSGYSISLNTYYLVKK